VQQPCLGDVPRALFAFCLTQLPLKLTLCNMRLCTLALYRLLVEHSLLSGVHIGLHHFHVRSSLLLLGRPNLCVFNALSCLCLEQRNGRLVMNCVGPNFPCLCRRLGGIRLQRA
jgi:hypothetical protein